MLASELIAEFERGIEKRGDFDVVDSDGFSIEEVSWPEDNLEESDCFQIFSEGDEH